MVLLIVLLVSVSGTALDVGDEAAPFVLPGMDKAYVYSKNIFNGENWVLLDFFATWCEPCKEKLPLIEDLYLRYQNKGLLTYLVATDKDGATVLKPFFDARPTPVPVLVDRYSVMADKYAVTNLPTLILVNPQGKIIYRLEGKSEAMIKDLEAFLSTDNG
ncbi:MAG: TlpA family protein disulfide reductase [Spirochaetales bacterium]|nr:TlpA family protein disulfide reductase [Spirochaetales bacterium]